MAKKAPAKNPLTISAVATSAPKKKAAPKKAPAKKRTALKSAAKPAYAGKVHKAASSAVFLAQDEYKRHIEGLMSQGIDRADAVDTMKIGIREANGLRISAQLLASIPQEAQSAIA